MRFMRLSALSPLLLLICGILCPGFLLLSLAPECRGEARVSNENASGYETDAVLEEELLTLTNQYRIRQGLEPLVPDNVLTQIAREHSYGMARQGFISHDLPSGDLETRMLRAGYSFEIARENLARASTVSIAENLMIRSPKHRNNILAADVTRVGIGVARHKQSSNKYIYVTQIFTAPRPWYPRPVVQNMAVGRLTELLCKSGSAPVQPDPLLENLASRSVLSLEIPVKRGDLRRLLADSADELIKEGRTELTRLEVAVQLLHDPTNFRIPEQAWEKGAGMFGTAVRQVTDDRNQAAFLILTLIGFTGEDVLAQNR